MNFSLEYILSLFIALLSTYYLHKAIPNMNAIITYFIVPILIAFISFNIFNSMFPWINRFGTDMDFYLTQKTYGNINRMGYLQIFPPLFIMLILFFILLYNRNLG